MVILKIEYRISRRLGAYAVLPTTVLHMKRLNQTESPIFVILCVLCFQRQSVLTLFYLNISLTYIIVKRKILVSETLQIIYEKVPQRKYRLATVSNKLLGVEARGVA